MELTTSIIPSKPTYAKTQGPRELNLEAICIYSAIGFFLDTDTFTKNKIALPPASKHQFKSDGTYDSSSQWFKWHYSPRNISFDEALEEFSDLFETIIKEQVGDRKVILPLSGGLDSRTQAAALKNLNSQVHAFSYKFENGYDEVAIAKKIAQSCGFEFESFMIERGYLWNVLDQLVSINQGYSDFTSPRQMAVLEHYDGMGDIFSLGHWGDVLFDSMKLPQLSNEEQLGILLKILVKKGGVEFASDLWEVWGLKGDFKSYFKERISQLLDRIEIEETNARLRAFKSKYWAPRWTAINLAIYESIRPISLPYFDDRMCQFICTVPEAYLENRKIQIAYIKKKAPELAKITWQDQRPFNLNNYQLNKVPFNLPFRIVNKIKRELNASAGRPYVQRNWELQFLGRSNQVELKKHLENFGLPDFLPGEFIGRYLNQFKSDAQNNAHAINMLLVLSSLKSQSIYE